MHGENGNSELHTKSNLNEMTMNGCIQMRETGAAIKREVIPEK
jgi:hypothetical protein